MNGIIVKLRLNLKRDSMNSLVITSYLHPRRRSVSLKGFSLKGNIVNKDKIRMKKKVFFVQLMKYL